MKTSPETAQAQGTHPVRCLDCGTIYEQPLGRQQSAACPNCGYVGWVEVSRREASATGSG